MTFPGAISILGPWAEMYIHPWMIASSSSAKLALLATSALTAKNGKWRMLD
jgi:hypothetical protein